MIRPRSLKAQFLFGSVLWTLGLLGASHMFFVFVSQHYPVILRVQHWVVLGLLALVFMLGGLSQVRRGITPINSLRARLAAVRDGRVARVEGDYPAEVEPLVRDLNALLARREEAVRRAQATAGNLAHGLKTPLALLLQQVEALEGAGHGAISQTMRQEVARMQRQVDYHLVHARAAASAAAPGARCVVLTSVEPLVRALGRLHADRNLSFAICIGAGVVVAVERQDLDEMLGNLLDNACKWGRSRVEVRAAREGTTAVVITVADDGAGVPQEMWARVTGRGVRADESTPGSGLGLAIVRDLAEVYGGSLTLGRADLGGLRATLHLPPA
jgi:signal transduction histidine kinase